MTDKLTNAVLIKTKSTVPIEIKVVFCACGLTNLLIWLLKNNLPVEKDKMIEYLCEMKLRE